MYRKMLTQRKIWVTLGRTNEPYYCGIGYVVAIDREYNTVCVHLPGKGSVWGDRETQIKLSSIDEYIASNELDDGKNRKIKHWNGPIEMEERQDERDRG